MLSLGRKIYDARRDLLLTQRELADKVGVTSQAVSRWERDEAPPNWRNLRLLAEVTGKPISHFFEEEKVA